MPCPHTFRPTSFPSNAEALKILAEHDLDKHKPRPRGASKGARRLVVDGIVGRETRTMLEREVELHGDPSQQAARAGGPCHTPDDPGSDDAATSLATPAGEPPKAVASGGRQRGAFLGDVFPGIVPVAFGLKGKQGDGSKGGVTAPPPAPGGDLVVQLTGEEISEALATANGGGQAPVKVASSDALVALLKARSPVGQLTIISHGLSDGTVRFSLGATEDIKLADLATKLAAGGVKVRGIVFRGCSIGNDQNGMTKLKTATGAVSVEGTKGHLESTRTGAIELRLPKGGQKGKLSGTVIVRDEATFQRLEARDQALYHRTLRQLLHETKHEDCLVGLARGQKSASLTDDQLRGIAMKNKGRLVTQHCKEDDSSCFQNMDFGGAGTCVRVQV